VLAPLLVSTLESVRRDAVERITVSRAGWSPSDCFASCEPTHKSRVRAHCSSSTRINIELLSQNFTTHLTNISVQNPADLTSHYGPSVTIIRYQISETLLSNTTLKPRKVKCATGTSSNTYLANTFDRGRSCRFPNAQQFEISLSFRIVASQPTMSPSWTYCAITAWGS
jgi:hypothetical protein